MRSGSLSFFINEYKRRVEKKRIMHDNKIAMISIHTRSSSTFSRSLYEFRQLRAKGNDEMEYASLGRSLVGILFCSSQ